VRSRARYQPTDRDTPTDDAGLREARSLRAVVAEHATTREHDRTLDRPTVEALWRSGLAQGLARPERDHFGVVDRGQECCRESRPWQRMLRERRQSRADLTPQVDRVY